MFNQTNFINNLNYENSILLSSRFITKINTINQYKKVSKLAIFFLNTVNLFKIILKIFSGFFLSFFSKNHKLMKQYLNKDNLVISHFDNQTNADYIFGNLFNDKFKNDSHSIFITNLDKKYKKTKLSKHIFKINIFYQIKIILNLYSISLKVLIDKSFQSIFEDSHQFKYLSMSYLEYDTFCNLLIFEYLKKNIELYNFKNIITTFEGHPWEILIFLYSHKKKIKTHAYLHTFLKRHSPYFFLSLKYFPNIIYTVGKEMSEVVFKNLNYPKNQIKILGSNKNINTFSFENIIEKKSFKNILLLPESIEDEVNIFLKFIDLYRNIDSINISIKFHPLYPVNNHVLKYYKNYITQSNLEDIIKDTDLIIYRGTSTIFELMKYKVISIYLSVNNELSRDPLFYCNNKFIINLDNIDDLILKINLLKKDNYLIDEFNFLRKKMINYYEPINKNNLP